MYNLSDYCCMCLQNKTLLYNLNMIDREDKIKLIEKFNFCVFEKDHIEENVPRNICDECIHHVKSAYKFKKMCLKNYSTLKNYVTQRKDKESNLQSTVNIEEISLKSNKIVEHRKSVSLSSPVEKSRTTDMCISTSKQRKIVEHRKSITVSNPSNEKNNSVDMFNNTYEYEKSVKRSKITQHRKSISVFIPSLENNNKMETKSNKNYYSGQSRKSVYRTGTSTSGVELLNTPTLESNKDKINNKQTNNRKLSCSEQEFIVNPPKEITRNVSTTSNQTETSLSFNKKYYGFTMTEIQSAHEYLFNIKILLKLVTVSSAIDSFNYSEVQNTLIRKKSQKNSFRKVFIPSVDNTSKPTAVNYISNVSSNYDKNKLATEINNNCMLEVIEDKSLDLCEVIIDLSDDNNDIDQDTNAALQNDEMITGDINAKRAFPAPRADDKCHQIHPFISKQIDSATELSKIVSDPKPLKEKTHMLTVLPTESLKPENLGNSLKQFNKAMNDVRSTLNRNSDYECQFCDRTFNRKQFLLLHYIVHCERDGSFYKCPICKEIFKDEPTVKQHLTSHYSKPTPRCYICKKIFTREYALALHILCSHKGIRSFKCHICEKSFARNSTLKVHLKSHTAYKDFQCKVCGKYLSQKVGLQRHMAIHTGQKPYACKICDNSFAYRCQLTDHVIRAHYNKEFNK